MADVTTWVLVVRVVGCLVPEAAVVAMGLPTATVRISDCGGDWDLAVDPGVGFV